MKWTQIEGYNIVYIWMTFIDILLIYEVRYLNSSI